jgi:3-oxoacyl-ACP reductase-like protein
METKAKISNDASYSGGDAKVVDTTTSRNAPSNPLEKVPQFANGDITFGELETAVKVLNAVAALVPSKKRKQADEAGLELYQHSNFRPLRKALARCVEIHQRIMYEGKSEDQYYDEKIKARSLKRQKMAERDLQKKYIADTELRRGRIERLKQKQSEAQDEEVAKLQQMMMIPDGHVDTNSNPKLITNEEAEAPETTQLPKLRSCYVCKARFRELHHFYDQLCPICAVLNWEKRHQTASLIDKVAVVTGSRVKIGYQTCLKLLRAGATVVATTRFPNAAVMPTDKSLTSSNGRIVCKFMD